MMVEFLQAFEALELLLRHSEIKDLGISLGISVGVSASTDRRGRSQSGNPKVVP